jgi:hypothetical protein
MNGWSLFARILLGIAIGVLLALLTMPWLLVDLAEFMK